jgi:hypothetical protein
LILGLAVLPNKPFNTSVLELYNSFVCGEIEVYDPETGELFNPDEAYKPDMSIEERALADI